MVISHKITAKAKKGRKPFHIVQITTTFSNRRRLVKIEPDCGISVIPKK